MAVIANYGKKKHPFSIRSAELGVVQVGASSDNWVLDTGELGILTTRIQLQYYVLYNGLDELLFLLKILYETTHSIIRKKKKNKKKQSQQILTCQQKQDK